MTTPTPPAVSEAMREAVARDYVLVKRGLYYRPNAMGYTGVLDDAGRYSEAEAMDHADQPSGVTAIPASEAPRFSDACWPETVTKTLEADLAKAASEIASLTGERDVAEMLLERRKADLRTAEAETARLRAERDAAVANAREPIGDTWDEIRRLEGECRIFIRERDEWKAVADRDLVRLTEERNRLRRDHLPHMCRNEHTEIRHGLSDDDERCPVCRERDRALAAEAETARLRAASEDAEQRVTNLAAALTSAHRARGVQEKRAAEADDRRVTLEKDRIHPAFSVEVQKHRQQAYEGGWSDGYAEGFAKAEARAALTSQEKTDV